MSAGPEETLRSGENNFSPKGIQAIHMEIQILISFGKKLEVSLQGIPPPQVNRSLKLSMAAPF